MKWIKKLLQKALTEEQYLFLVGIAFGRLFKAGMLGSEYQDIYHLKNIIRPGDHCVDIGAHLGYYTFQLSKLVGPHGKVIAIEPVSKFHAVLEKIIHRKKIKNITLHKVALGGKGEFVEIGVPRVNNQKKFGHARIRELSQWLEYADTEKVKNVSGNDLLADLPRLDFIKCDVEGAEVPVFTSMLQVLEKHKPIMICELADKNEFIKMCNMLMPLTYQTYILKKGKLLRIEMDSDEHPISHNYYFIPASRI
ncbi:MAG TPA: FkbM family methyltransferase [Chitinophagaceae bacterium]|nr:FkbM family methyltransferase [Chitinophagaceae bacterium]